MPYRCCCCSKFWCLTIGLHWYIGWVGGGGVTGLNMHYIKLMKRSSFSCWWLLFSFKNYINSFVLSLANASLIVSRHFPTSDCLDDFLDVSWIGKKIRILKLAPVMLLSSTVTTTCNLVICHNIWLYRLLWLTIVHRFHNTKKFVKPSTILLFFLEACYSWGSFYL